MQDVNVENTTVSQEQRLADTLEKLNVAVRLPDGRETTLIDLFFETKQHFDKISGIDKVEEIYSFDPSFRGNTAVLGVLFASPNALMRSLSLLGSSSGISELGTLLSYAYYLGKSNFELVDPPAV